MYCSFARPFRYKVSWLTLASHLPTRIAYVELSSVELVSQAIALTGTIVMGLPIMVTLTESERNNQGLASVASLPGAPMSG